MWVDLGYSSVTVIQVDFLIAIVNIRSEAISRAKIVRSHAGGESVGSASGWQFSQKPGCPTPSLAC